MSDKYSIKIEENPFICEKENDVVSHLKISTETTIAAAAPTVKKENNNTRVNVLPPSATITTSTVAASSLKENSNSKVTVVTSNKDSKNTSDKINPKKRKTRRGKSKRKSNQPYAKSQWKFQIPRRRDRGRFNMWLGQNPLVPYNTNKFLMEDHMPPHINTPSVGRTRDSSFSVDSEENYFYSLPEDEEEFLIKEFSSVYEDARTERLDAMTKPQLVQEYLQLEAAFDQMSRRMNAKSKYEESNDQQQDSESVIRKLQGRIAELSTDNIELRKELDNMKTTKLVSTLAKPKRNRNDIKMCSSTSDSSSSSDSESDSTSTTSSSDSHISDNDDNDNNENRLYTNNHINNNSNDGDSIMDADSVIENHIEQKLIK